MKTCEALEGTYSFPTTTLQSCSLSRSYIKVHSIRHLNFTSDDTFNFIGNMCFTIVHVPILGGNSANLSPLAVINSVHSGNMNEFDSNEF